MAEAAFLNPTESACKDKNKIISSPTTPSIQAKTNERECSRDGSWSVKELMQTSYGVIVGSCFVTDRRD